MLEEIIMNLGRKGSLESMMYINAQIKRAYTHDQKAQKYAEQRYYPVGHPRKLLIEKRNDCFNAVLFELRKNWHDDNGNMLFPLPAMLRPYQENAENVKSVCKQFLVMEYSDELKEILKRVM